MVGGTASILVKFLLFYVAIHKFIHMIQFIEPKLETLSKGYDYHNTEKHPWASMGAPMVSIVKGTGANPLESITLDRESRRYVHIEANHHIKSYDKDGKYSQVINKYLLTKCSHS